MYNGDVKLAIVTCVAKVMNITDNRWATCQQNGSILECELSVRCLPWTRVSGSVFQKAVETLGRRVSLEEVGHWEWALKSKCTASLAACSRLREIGGYVTSCLPPHSFTLSPARGAVSPQTTSQSKLSSLQCFISGILQQGRQVAEQKPWWLAGQAQWKGSELWNATWVPYKLSVQGN